MTSEPKSLLAEAETLFRRGEFDRSLVLLRARLSQDGGDLPALALLIEASTAVAVYDKPAWPARAAAAVEEIRARGEMSEETAVRVGRILLNRREIVGARSVVQMLERRSPPSAAAALFLSGYYRQIGEPAAGHETLLRAAEAHPEDASLKLAIGEWLVSTGRGAEALRYAKGLKNKDSSDAALILLARARIASGQPEAAPPQVLQVFRNRAKVKTIAPVVGDLLDAGAPALASTLMGELAALSPPNAELLRLSASVHLAQGKRAEAAADLAAALELDPSAPAFERLVDLLLDLERVSQAEKLLRRMEEAHPRTIATSVVRAKVWRAMGAGARAQAVEDTVIARAARIGTSPMGRRHVGLAGIIGSHGLGDFIYQLLALASLKRQFSEAWLTLLYANDLSYKQDLLRFCPDLDEVRDHAGGAASIPVASKDQRDFRHHMIFPPAALSPTLLARLDRTATLVTPRGEVDRLTADLVDRGLDPDRWFVAMHCRQGASFSARMAGARDVDPRTFHQLAAEICAEGGQVVRLGHRGMAAIPQTPGYVDLSDAGIALQLFAVSKARFMVGCDSGPSGYATAFKTPLFKTNTFSEDGAAYASDLILPKNVLNWRGEVLGLGEVFEDRLVYFKDMLASSQDFRFVDNTIEQLRVGVDLLMKSTEGGGWRPDAPADDGPAPEAIAWPTAAGRRARLLDLAHLFEAPLRPVSAEKLLRP